MHIHAGQRMKTLLPFTFSRKCCFAASLPSSFTFLQTKAPNISMFHKMGMIWNVLLHTEKRSMFSFSSFWRSDTVILLWVSDTFYLKPCWVSWALKAQYLSLSIFWWKAISSELFLSLIVICYCFSHTKKKTLFSERWGNLRQISPCFCLHSDNHKKDSNWIKYSLKKYPDYWKVSTGPSYLYNHLSIKYFKVCKFCMNSARLMKNRSLLLIHNNKISILEKLILLRITNCCRCHSTK